MRILSTELSQLKRIAIINAISTLNLTPLPIVLSDSKIDKKRATLFRLVATRAN